MITLTPSSTIANSYRLNWSSQQTHIFDGLKQLVGQDDILLTDVTLACDGEYIQAHKLVLSLCSSFFKDLFQKNRADKSNTIIILGNVSPQNLRYLIQFMYQGKVDIPSKDVDSFLQAGNTLKIEGLMGGVGGHQEFDHSSSREEMSQNGNSASASGSSQSASERTSFVPPPAPASKKLAGVSLSRSDASSAIPNKKPRITDPVPGPSSSMHTLNVSTSPVIVGEPISLNVSSKQNQSSYSAEVEDRVRDPLESATHYNEELEADVEEGVDFNNLKTEPIQVYTANTYDDEDQSEMMHDEGSGEGDIEDFIGSVDQSFQISGLSAPIAVPGPSTSSVSIPGRSRGSLPGSVQRRPYHHQLIIGDRDSKRAPVYNYFDAAKGTPGVFFCRICARRVSSKGGTSNMLTHMRVNHPEECESGPLAGYVTIQTNYNRK
ncbi:unnamed protein product [Orchesella dallaii]|uniref:BTB domain-containing protein n=1 Tax=Orchesella dallaii TaxID=48710 RepID=A0ABP1QNM4_9HEXA